MKKSQVFFFLFAIMFLFFSFPAKAQTNNSDPAMASTQFDTSGFPLWAKDLRRAEIITFGSFPFAYFFSNFIYDTYRWSNNGWDTRYAPWPITSAGAVSQTQSEKIMTLGIAAGAAVLIALVDYGITRYKRHLLAKESSKTPEGTTVIVRRPLASEETDASAPAAGSEANESR